MKLAWVLGSSGLLGSALCRSLSACGTKLFTPAERFCWAKPPQLFSQLAEAVQAFATQAEGADQWQVYWAAGVGTMSRVEASLTPETQALDCLLRLLEAESRLVAKPGALAFASSAGALYAGTLDEVITEDVKPTPTTDYAHEKLKQEDLIRSFSNGNNSITTLIARISTLYGVGQSSGKPQGLLSHIARCAIRRQPIQIYVPYDTIRDYISADDAATVMVNLVNTTCGEKQLITKIIASERSVTIAEIISIFKRIERRAPLIVTSASKLSSLYARRVQFRSIALPNVPRIPSKPLLVGVAQIIAAERLAFVLAGV